MSIKNFSTAKVALVCPQGQLMGGPETFDLSAKIEKLYSSGQNNIVLDLSNVVWANSLNQPTTVG